MTDKESSSGNGKKLDKDDFWRKYQDAYVGNENGEENEMRILQISNLNHVGDW